MAAGLIPTPTPDSMPFWTAAREGRLVVQRCRSCGHHYFYPRDACPRCSSIDVEWQDTKGHGRLVSYVINHRPFPPADASVPQVIALVELDEGIRLLTNIVDTPPDPDQLPLDAEVTVGFEPRGDWQLPVFRLVSKR
jgi:uncharacterized OB-fold protein